MNRNLLLLAAALCGLSLSGLAVQHDQAPAPAPRARAVGPVKTFTGEISDGQCARNGGHAQVMKRASINTAANCTKGCARRHGYVLYNAASQKTYRLDDQGRPAEFAAKKVRVTGNLDGDTIHVLKIQAAK